MISTISDKSTATSRGVCVCVCVCVHIHAHVYVYECLREGEGGREKIKRNA